jgi:steroid 5-alpha reductase family enzyme
LDPSNKQKVLKSGLWKYSRYPNYFGEILLWTGVFLSSVNALSDMKNIGIAIISPTLTFLLLRFVSGVRLSDQRYNKRFGEDKEWISYKESTNLFIPGFPIN